MNGLSFTTSRAPISIAHVSAILLLCLALITGSLVACTGQDASRVAVRFAVKGSTGTSLTDLRFYIYDIDLLTDRGQHHAVHLSGDGKWQSEHVALLDLVGAERNEMIAGSLAGPPQTYTGIRFTLGVPFKLNHANPLTAAPPLNRGDLFWSWQSGYKFLRLDAAAGAFHLGSTGCSSASALRPPSAPCAQPNRVQVELRGFDPTREAVQVDWQSLLTALSRQAPVACTGDYARSDACAQAYAATGLDIQTGRCAQGGCATQRLFLAPRAP